MSRRAKKKTKKQIRLNFFDLLRRQNFVAEIKIFTKILQYTRMSLQRVVCRNVLQVVLELVA